MRKICLTDDQRRDASLESAKIQLKQVLRYQMEGRGISTWKQLAASVGIPQSTFNSKINRPEQFTYKDLIDICYVLKLGDDDRSKLLGGKP